MATTPRPWIVTPHGPIEPIDDNLWGVESYVPGIPGKNFPRRMSIIRRADGALVLHNALPLDDAGLARLRALGPPTFLVLPSPFHCIDAHAMRQRLGLKSYCPGRCADEIGARVPIDGHVEQLPEDPAVRFMPLGGVKTGEGVLLVSSGDGARTSLVVCDVVLNVPHQRGFWGLIWRLGGFTGAPRCGPIWLKRAVGDRGALRTSLEQLAGLAGLTRIVPSHGPVIEQGAAEVLRQIAAAL